MILRWVRSPALVALAFSIVVAIAAIAAIEQQIQTKVSSALDENSRGLYDILLTPSGKDFGASDTRGFVDGNYLTAAGEGGITLAQLDQVRGFSDTEVAAPIGIVGGLRSLALTPSIYLRDDPAAGITALPSSITAGIATSTLEEYGPTGWRPIWRSTGAFAVPQRSVADVQDLSSSKAAGAPSSFTPQITNLDFEVPLGTLPSFAATVIAVDPTAEKKLLGKQGDFLKPLLGLPTDRIPTKSNTLWSKLVDESKFLVEQTAIQSAEQSDTRSGPAVPLLVNNGSPAKLRITVDLKQDRSVTEIPSSSAQLQSDVSKDVLNNWAHLQQDVSDLAVPYSSPDLTVFPPGSALPAGDSIGSFYQSAPQLVPFLFGRPTYTPAESSSTGTKVQFEVVPKTVTGPDGLPEGTLPSDQGLDQTTGQTRSYRTATDTSGAGFQGSLPAPIATFSGAKVRYGDPSSTAYVPPGIFDHSQTRAIKVSGLDEGASLSPNLTNLDFITAQPGAITDLKGGEVLRGSTPIDAVRVRVRGSGFSAGERLRILHVAEQATQIGLTATVVSGSSPQAVAIYVPKYFVDGQSRDKDLGWVRQDWTTLGASVTVKSAVTVQQSQLVWFSGLALVLALLSSAVLLGRRNAHRARVLLSLGWTPARTLRYLSSDGLPGVILAVAVGSAAIAVVNQEKLLIAGFVVSLVIALAAASLLAATVALRSSEGGRGLFRSRHLVGQSTLALRQVLSHPGISGAQVFGLLVIGLSSLFTVIAVSVGTENFGATRLAALTIDLSSGLSIALGAAGAVAALVVAVLGRRVEMRRRSADTAVFRSLGISGSTVAAVHVTETLIVGATAVVLTIAISVGAVVLLGLSTPLAWIPSATILISIAAVSLLGRAQLR